MGLEEIKKLREHTSLGIKDCQSALEEAGGDFNRALEILKSKGTQIMQKKSSRETSQGLIEAYVHFGGNLGTLVEVNCESDFVARTPVFKSFVKDLAMHIAATNPVYINREDIPQEEREKIENMEDYAKEKCLLEQLFVKDPKATIGEYLKNIISQTGENVIVKRFVRFSLTNQE